ncbi:MAG: RES family NAD+ phosphorylase [Candidatus Binataceae bacterium]
MRGRGIRLKTPPQPSGKIEPLRARILTGVFWRQCSPKRGLLEVANPAVSAGRYHREGGPAAWYASSSESGAWKELFRHHEPGGVSPLEVRRRIGSARVKRLSVLDLTDPRVRATLNLSDRDLIGDNLARCQKIAEEARRAGYDGILAPSAALEGARTLVVFARSLRKVSETGSRMRRAPPTT